MNAVKTVLDPLKKVSSPAAGGDAFFSKKFMMKEGIEAKLRES